MEVRRLRSDELQHHGVKGMHWGIRRYQNPDGTLTAEGQKRYYKYDGSLTRKGRKEYYTQHFETKLRNAKTKDEKTYILRSEARKNALDINSTMKKGTTASLISVGATMASGVATALSGGTMAPITAALFGTTFASIIGTSIAISGKQYTKSIENAKLADLADKYGIEDVKIRSNEK